MQFAEEGRRFERWTIQKLKEQHDKNLRDGLKGIDRMGVGRAPFLKEGTLVIFPGLHGLIGIGNQIVDYLYDQIDKEIEPITPEELVL